MKPVRLLAGALLAGLQAACASTSNVGDDGGRPGSPPPPADVMAIHTYWAGEEPPCPVVRVTELSARSENGLRWGAWQARAQAVVSVSVRGRTIGSTRERPAPMSSVYEGVAVRFAEGCTEPKADSAA